MLRALAKDPDERYQTAEEMDAELARVAEGLPVSAQTAEAATQVLAGAGIAEAATVVTRPRPADATPPATPVPPYRPPAHGYYYDEPPPRGRPFWPWLVALLLLLAAGGAVWLAWGKIQDEINKNETVAVPDVRGIREILAVRRLRAADLAVSHLTISRVADDDTPAGFVISQDPPAGDRVSKGKVVSLRVSIGQPTSIVPDVRGRPQTDALQILVDRDLRRGRFDVPSKEPQGTVVAQSPAPGKRVPRNTNVRINISKGPQQVSVPSVVGELFEDAAPLLQQAGFAVARRDVDSNEQAGVVLAQNPRPNSVTSEGATITLSVSRGPSAIEVPEVTGLRRVHRAGRARGGRPRRAGARPADDRRG